MNPVHPKYQPCRHWFRCGLLAGAVLLYFLLAGRGFALDPARDVLQYNLQTWSRPNGLPVNGINAITQTRDGYLWLGTSVGLVRFDGVEFKLLDLGRVPHARSSIVNSLSSARDGGMWVSLENSSFGFCDGQTFSFRGNQAGGSAGHYLEAVRSILESQDGAVWLGTDGALLRLTRSGGCEEVLSGTTNSLTRMNNVNISCSYEEPGGRLWFGTFGQGVYCWQSGKLTRIPDPALNEMIVHSVAVDQQGQIWVGTTVGLFCYDSNLARNEIPVLPSEIRALLVDRHGVLWIGTSGDGLVCYRTGAYSHVRKTDGLAGDYVTTLAEDREGSLWIGTRDGLSQLTDVKFNTQPAAADPAVRDALAVGTSRKGGIWVGSSAGLTYFDGKPRTYGIEAGLTNPYTKRVFEASNGDVYLVSGLKTLLVFSGDKVVATHAAPDMVVGMAEDAYGVVVSAGGALYRAGRDYFTPYAFTNGEPALGWVLNLAPGRHGEIWVACVSGIFSVKDGGYQQWGAVDDPTGHRVDWICEDNDGAVWGASFNGIVRLKDSVIRPISRENGLFDNNVYSVVPDDFGNLWVDSGRGIFKVGRKNMNDFADGKTNWVACVAYDGPESVKPSDKSNQEHMACKTPDGRIWFPAANGVVEIDPAHIPSNGIAPPVQIDSIRANGLEQFRSNGVVVPPGHGDLEIHFTALSYIAPHSIRFRYRLDGCEKDWVETRDRRAAYYTNLKPGRYQFHVIAANADGVWNETGDSIAIELRPHYYETASFKGLCGGLVCAALLGFVFRLVREQRRKQEEMQKAREFLEAEVRSRTAELARANTSLQQEIAGHEETEIQLKQRTQSLEHEIEERKRVQKEVERAHRELLEISRMAGMSEIATNVLHNVGNVLNSVNVSAAVVKDQVTKSKVDNLAKVAALLKAHEHDLGTFVAGDPKGRQVLSYLGDLSKFLLTNQAATIQELESLQRNVEHINQIVLMQQSYARVAGVKEIVDVHGLVEDSLRMNLGAMERHGVIVIRDFQKVPPINVEKHKVLQILINLLRNAKYACDESGRPDKQLTVRVAGVNGWLKISVADNGVGIPPENLTRIFSHGFTTRSNGHGFGLHGGALAAKEMGGTLSVHSDGPGKGASFTLELPLPPVEEGVGHPRSSTQRGADSVGGQPRPAGPKIDPLTVVHLVNHHLFSQNEAIKERMPETPEGMNTAR